MDILGIADMQEETCRLRKAEWSDVDLLFAWANDKEVRENSFSTEPIPYERHISWFQKKCQEKDSQVYIFCEADQEKGMLRLDFDGNEVTLSYSIAAEERGKGHGQKLILLAEQEICRQLKGMAKGFRNPNRDMGQKACDPMVVKAQVKSENVPSNRIFTKLGYEKCGMEYRKKLYAVAAHGSGKIEMTDAQTNVNITL